MDLPGNDDETGLNNLVKVFSDAGENSEPEEAKRRGRPQTVTDAGLLSARNYLVWLLENTWSEIGWNLRRIKTSADVQAAFKIWETYEVPHYVVSCLLRSSETPATMRLNALRHRLLIQLHTVHREACDLKQNRRDAFQRVEQVLKLKHSSDQRKAIEQEHARLASSLQSVEQFYLSITAYRTSLEPTLKNGHTYVARREIAEFCTQAKYAINPLNVANAMAGLPFMSYRQSIDRTRDHECVNKDSLPYQIFKTIGRIVESRAADVKLLQHAEQWLRVKKKPEPHAIDELRGTWYYLKPSITTAVNAKVHPRELPYRITAEYYRKIAVRTATDRVLEGQHAIQ